MNYPDNRFNRSLPCIVIYSFLCRSGFVVYYNGKVGKSANAECKRSEYEDCGIWKFLNTNEAIECVEGNMKTLKAHREK